MPRVLARKKIPNRSGYYAKQGSFAAMDELQHAATHVAPLAQMAKLVQNIIHKLNLILAHMHISICWYQEDPRIR
jgi:hypothetical protein